MSFFGLFKSKQDRNQSNEFNQLLDTIFPGGEEDVLRDIDRVSRYTHGKIPHGKIRGFVVGCKTLVHISETHDVEEIVQSFISRSENLISDSEAYEVFVYFAGEATYVNNITRSLGAKGAPLNAGVIQLLAKMEALYAKGTYEDRILGSYGEFGKSVTNPIPMISAKGSNNYLSNLLFEGHQVEYVKSGSTSSPVTDGKLDVYGLTVDGEDVGTLYICPYHRRNCRSAPDGFTLNGSSPLATPSQAEKLSLTRVELEKNSKQTDLALEETNKVLKPSTKELFKEVMELYKREPEKIAQMRVSMDEVMDLVKQKRPSSAKPTSVKTK